MNRWISTCGLMLTIALAGGMLAAQETKKAPPGGGRGYKQPVKQSTDAAKAARRVRTKRADARDSKGPVLPSTGRTRPQRRDMSRGMLHRQQIIALQGQLARKRQEFMEYTGELRAIRKIAMGENAKKTAEYIDKLIARRKTEFETAVKDIHNKIKEIGARVKKQLDATGEKLQKVRGPRPIPPGPKDADTRKALEKKEK